MHVFFYLTNPDYEDDFEDEKINPVWVESPYNIPGFICPTCGPRGVSDRLRIPLPPEKTLEEFKGMQHLTLAQWQKERPRWAELLGVPLERITPAAEIGPPCGLLKGMPTADVLHPSGEIWIRTHVMKKLKETHCTGVEFAKASLVYRPTDPESFCEGVHVDYEPIDLTRLPEYWEVTVTGRAWSEEQSEGRTRVCDLCGRTSGGVFPDSFRADELQWDGSDFFNFNGFNRIILVTERVCKALAEIGASNYLCKPLPT